MRIVVLGVLTSVRGVKIEYLRDVEPVAIVATGRFCHACFSGAYEVGFPRENTAQLALFGPE